MAEPQGVSKADAMAEAYKRGILPPDKAAAFEEAQRRGLLKPSQASGGDELTAWMSGAQQSPQLMEDPLGGPPVMPFGSEPDPYSPPLQQAKPKEPAGYWERVGQTNPLRILDSMASGMTNAAYFGFDDEIAGAASWLGVPGLGNYKANQDRMRAEQPIAFMGGQMSTAFLPTGGALKALNPSTLKGTAAVGGATGMAQGALHGFGDTDGSLEQRNEGAQLGGLTGGAFGTVLTGGSRLLPEMLGDMSRGVRKQLPKGVPGAIEKAPSLKDLEALKNAAYKRSMKVASAILQMVMLTWLAVLRSVLLMRVLTKCCTRKLREP